MEKGGRGTRRTRDLETELAQEREQRQRLEERLSALESGKENPEGDYGPSGDSEGWYLNKAGNLCLGRVCLTTEATETGLEFTLDPASCDPETREKLIGAMIKGAKLKLK